MWNFVIEHFNVILQNSAITNKQLDDIAIKASNINSCLVAKYYPHGSILRPLVLAGSHRKGVAIRPISDVDALFVLPNEIACRFEKRRGNVQSQILQELRSHLLTRFSQTSIKGDGQVVVIDFSTIKFEIAPAIHKNELFITCDSNYGGSWKLSDLFSECRKLDRADELYAGKARDLVRLLKCWKHNKSVPIKSVQLEIAACTFLHQWQYRYETSWYYDWMLRDFFYFLLQYENGTTRLPTGEIIPLGREWVNMAKQALVAAQEACEMEMSNSNYLAQAKWREIVGNRFTSPHIYLPSMQIKEVYGYP